MTLGLDGVDLSYTDLGSGDPLLLVHGTGAYSAIWGETPGQLAGSRRVIVYDRRGFGASQGERAQHVHQHAQDAAALLEHLGATPAVVVGWSGGGPIALDLAASRPELVGSLVLIEPAVSLILAPSTGLVRMSSQMQFRWRILRDERAAAATMYRWANSYITGGNAFDRLPREEQEGMLAHSPSPVCKGRSAIRCSRGQ
jgi:3-oxoadipate enol-lactonase